MRLLTIDVETSPNLAHVWSLWNVNVSLAQLRETGQVISFAAKWNDKKGVIFKSDYHDGHEAMVTAAHALIDEADAVIHYNGTGFDMPLLRREFLLAGLKPPSPVQEIDLLRIVKKHFRFPSNKLDHVTRELGLAGKASHAGHELWVKCLAQDPKAWAVMAKYNKQDVVITEQLYSILRPWITNHPHVGLIDGKGEQTCNKCGSDNLQLRGWRHTLNRSYRRAQCMGCGGWVSFTTSEASVKTRGA